MKQFIQLELAVGQRLDKAVYEFIFNSEVPELAQYKGILSRSLIGKQLAHFITVNSKVAKPAYKVKAGDKVVIAINSFVQQLDLVAKANFNLDNIQPQEGKLEIVYENADFIVINKAQGMVVHPGVGNELNTVANYLKQYLIDKGEYDSAVQRAGIVHRLDKGVGGLMVLAKTRASQIDLQTQFETHKVVKIYLADVVPLKTTQYTRKISSFVEVGDYKEFLAKWKKKAYPKSAWIRVQGYIARDSSNRKRRIVTTLKEGDGKAVDSYMYPLSSSRFLINIVTGRMHQIRATLRHMGYVIVGDRMYGYKLSDSSDVISLRSILLSFESFGQKFTFVL